jgi:hypothetical protein
VFQDRKTKKKLFQVDIGSPDVGLWNYGITEEGDFNGDGIQDYAWYGGDDGGDVMYVFLSSQGAYQKLDIYETLQHEWARIHHSAALSSDESSSFFSFNDPEHVLAKIRFIRSATGLILAAEISSGSKPNAPPLSLRVESSAFVFSKPK